MAEYGRGCHRGRVRTEYLCGRTGNARTGNRGAVPAARLSRLPQALGRKRIPYRRQRSTPGADCLRHSSPLTGSLLVTTFGWKSSLARGLTNREIASALHISSSTIKNHVKNILTKLDVAGRTEAVILC